MPEALAPGWDRDRIAAPITRRGRRRASTARCAEIYREEAFAAAGLGPATRLPVAAEVHETSLAFFVHPTLGDADIDDTIAAVAQGDRGGEPMSDRETSSRASARPAGSGTRVLVALDAAVVVVATVVAYYARFEGVVPAGLRAVA